MSREIHRKNPATGRGEVSLDGGEKWAEKPEGSDPWGLGDALRGAAAGLGEGLRAQVDPDPAPGGRPVIPVHPR